MFLSRVFSPFQHSFTCAERNGGLALRAVNGWIAFQPVADGWASPRSARGIPTAKGRSNG